MDNWNSGTDVLRIIGGIMATTEQQNAIDIAVLREQIGGLREQSRMHNEVTQKRFNNLETKIDELMGIMNRGKGAYAASMGLAAALGAALIEGFSSLTSLLHTK